MKPVFIFGCSHRCGSTLLQRLLNSTSDVMIWGEHDGYLNDYFWNFTHLVKWADRHNEERMIFIEKGYDDFLPNIIPSVETLREAARIYILSLFAIPAARLGRKVWGFKEVRYGVEIALALQDLFPGARIIHINRNLIDVYMSLKSWEATNPEWSQEFTKRSVNNWLRINRGFIEAGREIHNLFQVRYEDMIVDPTGFTEQLAVFLDMPVEKFDQRVFARKLRIFGDTGEENEEKPILIELTDQDKTLLMQPKVEEIAAAFGYTIEL